MPGHMADASDYIYAHTSFIYAHQISYIHGIYMPSVIYICLLHICGKRISIRCCSWLCIDLHMDQCWLYMPTLHKGILTYLQFCRHIFSYICK